MLLDLVQTTTRDGIRLDGSFQSPGALGSASLSLDSVCLVHGTGSNFYSSTLFDSLAARFLELGCAVLRINTRGHDLMSNAATPKGSRRLGAAYELVDECRHDLVAWIEWLQQRAGPRIGLVGHSLGAVKCLYALAQDNRLPIRCLAALSPPRLSYSWFCANSEGPQFLESYARAERYLEEGQPAALLEVKVPLSYAISAAGYVDKYGPDERYNYLSLLPGVPCPLLLTLGSIEMENHMPFRGIPEALASLGNLKGRLTVQTIAGADHFYSGVRADLVACVETWMRGLV
jgi:pimeloyl-ACP methyl ester carboxylesterase